ARPRPLVLGLRVPQFELPPRAPLLRRRALLPAARAAARAAAVLRAARHAVADLFRPPLRLAGREPRAAHRLERGARGGERSRRSRFSRDVRAAPGPREQVKPA